MRIFVDIKHFGIVYMRTYLLYGQNQFLNELLVSFAFRIHYVNIRFTCTHFAIGKVPKQANRVCFHFFSEFIKDCWQYLPKTFFINLYIFTEYVSKYWLNCIIYYLITLQSYRKFSIRILNISINRWTKMHINVISITLYIALKMFQPVKKWNEEVKYISTCVEFESNGQVSIPSERNHTYIILYKSRALTLFKKYLGSDDAKLVKHICFKSGFSDLRWQKSLIPNECNIFM